VDGAGKPVPRAWAALARAEAVPSLFRSLDEDQPPNFGSLTVVIDAAGNRSFEGPDSPDHAYGASDGKGGFRFPGRLPGRYLLLAGAPGFLETWQELALPLADPAQEASLVLLRGLEIGGRAVDAETGEGVAGVEIEAVQETRDIGGLPWTRTRRAVSGSNGAFRALGFSPGRAALRQVPYIGEGSEGETPDGKDARGRGKAEYEGSPVEAQAGDLNVVFRMDRMGLVEFSALVAGTKDPVGSPIRAEREPKGGDAPDPGVWRSGPGKILLRDRPGLRGYVLTAEGFEPAQALFELPAGSRTSRPEPVFFARRRAIEGWVTLDTAEGVDGEARAGQVRVFYESLEGGEAAVAMVRAKAEAPWRARFRISSFVAGRVRLVAVAPGYASSVAEVRAGETGATQDFHLLPRRPGAPPPEKRIPYRERKDVLIAFNVEDLTLEETLEWAGEATRADLRIRPGTKGAQNLSMDLQDAPLSSLVDFVKMIGGLEFDEETGEFFRKE
jgi:hypothetical protein